MIIKKVPIEIEMELVSARCDDLEKKLAAQAEVIRKCAKALDLASAELEEARQFIQFGLKSEFAVEHIKDALAAIEQAKKGD